MLFFHVYNRCVVILCYLTGRRTEILDYINAFCTQLDIAGDAKICDMSVYSK